MNEYYAHLKALDAAYLTALRAAGYKRRNNLMVNDKAGIKVNRVGFANGYTIQWGPVDATSVANRQLAETVDETLAVIARITSGN